MLPVHVPLEISCGTYITKIRWYRQKHLAQISNSQASVTITFTKFLRSKYNSTTTIAEALTKEYHKRDNIKKELKQSISGICTDAFIQQIPKSWGYPGIKLKIHVKFDLPPLLVSFSVESYQEAVSKCLFDT